MSSSKSSIRTPLARVRGLGSARAGTSDFWQQRLTAIAMVLLIVPAIVIVMMLLSSSYATATQIFRSTTVAIVLILFTIASVWHMKIGMQVVIEDYVIDEKRKLISIIGNNLFSVAVALAAIYAILKLSLGV
jgi:succinate dehydrogenase / fumarate reductase membrane anchor subunit